MPGNGRHGRSVLTVEPPEIRDVQGLTSATLRRGREAGHVGAGLGDDRLGGALADAGNGLQAGEDVGVVGGQLGDAVVKVADGVVEPVDVVQELAQLGGVVVAEAGVERPDELGDLAAQSPLGQVGEHHGVALAGDQRLDHRPAGLGQRPGRDRADLDHAVFEHLLNPLGLRGAGLDQPLAVPGDRPQPADVSRRHERGTQQPALQQLREPCRVSDVGLASGHVLDVTRVAQQQLKRRRRIGIVRVQRFLEHPPHRQPVVRCGLHRHMRHPLLE